MTDATTSIDSRAPQPYPWLFSRNVDLLAFGGSAALALALLAIGSWLGLLNRDSPEWTWVTAVLLIDVAHVYATGFRVYFDPHELRRRPVLYWATPLAAFVIGWAVATESVSLFWRLLAYLAVFHFVRQQYGWVALYRAKAGEHGRTGRLLDSAAIYLATIYPLVYWHCHLPRGFWWFLEGDFVELPTLIADCLQPVYWVVMASYCARSVIQIVTRHHWNPGKDLVVATTAVCWYVGIVTFNSDYAFTVTNVIIHGIPYMALVYWYYERQRDPTATTRRSSLVMFLATIWLLAYVEELFWDRGVWHERTWLFGQWELPVPQTLLIALLAVPQLTHYILDGFIWKRRSNQNFAQSIARDSA